MWITWKKLNNVAKAEETIEELLALLPEILNLSVSVLFIKHTNLQNLVKVYRIIDKTDEAYALEDRLVEAMLEVGARPSTADTVKHTLELVEYLFEQGNYSRAAYLAQFGYESTRHLDRFQQEEARGLKLDLQLLVGRSKFHAGNYSEGLDYIELVMDDIYKLGPLNYSRQFETACPYVFFRLRFGCATDDIVQAMTFIVARSIYIIFGILLDMDVTFESNTSTSSSHPEFLLSQISTEKALTIREEAISLWSTAYQVGDSFLHSQIKSWYYSTYSWLISILYFLSSPFTWAIQFWPVRFIVNVLWVFSKLLLLLIFCFFSYLLAFTLFDRLLYLYTYLHYANYRRIMYQLNNN